MSLRPESSVSLFLNEWGELVCDADRQGPVIHRTPEELGIPAVMKDVPRVPSWFKPSADTGPGSAGRSKHDRRRKFALPTMKHNRASALKAVTHINSLYAAAAKVQEAQLREIGGEPVLMPAAATMGAEPLEGFIAERRKEEERMQERVVNREKCAYPGCEFPAVEGRKYCSKKHAWKNSYVPAAQKAKLDAPNKTLQRVDVDPGRPGSASSLVNALAKIDAEQAQLKVEIQLTHAEVARVIEKLDPAQRVAFLNAGLRAASLA